MKLPAGTDDYQTLMYGENLELLKAQPLFLGLNEEEIIKFISISKPIILEMEPGRSIRLEPGIEKRIGFIIEGDVKAYAIDYSGNRTVVNSIDKYSSVEPVISTLHSYNMLVEISTGVPSRVVLFKPEYIYETIEEIAAVQHKLAVSFMKYERRLLVTLTEHILCIAQKTTRDKIMRYLFIRSEAAHSYEFDIPLSREEMAEYLTVDRASLSRSLGELKREGIIDFRKNHFKILDANHFKY